MLELLREYFLEILGLIGAGAASFWAYVTGRRRTKAETEQVEADVVKSIQELYKGLVEDMQAITEEARVLREELAKTRSNMSRLITEVESLRSNVITLEQDLDDCRKGISRLNI